MIRYLYSIFLLLEVFSPSFSQQVETYDYARAQRDMVSAGVQAIMMCNGLFTSERTLQQIFDQELTYLSKPIGTAQGGDYQIDWERKTVAIGTPGGTPVMRAVFRKGLGCIILAPDQTFKALDDLPELPTSCLGSREKRETTKCRKLR